MHIYPLMECGTIYAVAIQRVPMYYNEEIYHLIGFTEEQVKTI